MINNDFAGEEIQRGIDQLVKLKERAERIHRELKRLKLTLAARDEPTADRIQPGRRDDLASEGNARDRIKG